MSHVTDNFLNKYIGFVGIRVDYYYYTLLFIPRYLFAAKTVAVSCVFLCAITCALLDVLIPAYGCIYLYDMYKCLFLQNKFASQEITFKNQIDTYIYRK